MRGRKPTTGRYDTREELVASVWRLYDLPGMSIAKVARACRISEATAGKILDQPRPAQAT